MKITLNADRTLGTISRHIYGHFTEHLGRCIYGGIYVGPESPIPNVDGIRLDVIDALKQIAVPNLRWPGGCFADEYHWQDGIGPKDQRPAMINNNWGGVTENNHFGTHEFLRLCELVGCEPYINGNVGSGTVQEMSQWVEYLNSDNISPMTNERKVNGREKSWGVKYFGVGNENWGCGGQMRPEYYADLYRRYVCYCRNYGENKLYRIACGSSSVDYRWTEVLMREAARYMDGLSLHHYSLPTGNWSKKGAAYGFPVEEWLSTMKQAWLMDELIIKHSTIMDQYDPDKRIGLIVDEWGAWYDVEPGTNPGFLYQQNSLRDALVAGLTLNIFNRHCNRVHMANLAQTVNVLQSVLLTEGEKIIRTPTWHVFEMYQVHQDAELLDCDAENIVYEFDGKKIPAISISASRRNGEIHLTMCNIHHELDREIELDVRGAADTGFVAGRLLHAPALDTCNTFDAPELVCPQPYRIDKTGPSSFAMKLPAHSVALVTLK